LKDMGLDRLLRGSREGMAPLFRIVQ
jgi:hypothetical protein